MTTTQTRPKQAKGRTYAAARHPCLTYKQTAKRAYLTEVDAKEASERINAYRSVDGHVLPYLCRRCDCYHLGHVPREPKEHRRQRADIDRYLRSSIEVIEFGGDGKGERVANCIVAENMKCTVKGELHIRKLARIAQDGIRIRV
jgi:hypothetical protein